MNIQSEKPSCRQSSPKSQKCDKVISGYVELIYTTSLFPANLVKFTLMLESLYTVFIFPSRLVKFTSILFLHVIFENTYFFQGMTLYNISHINIIVSSLYIHSRYIKKELYFLQLMIILPQGLAVLIHNFLVHCCPFFLFSLRLMIYINDTYLHYHRHYSCIKDGGGGGRKEKGRNKKLLFLL